MKKRVVSLLAVMALTVGMLAGCGSSSDSSADTKDAAADESAEDTADSAEGTTSATTVKAGYIFLHDEKSTYDLNFLNAAKEACEKLGIEYMTKTNIPEGQEC